MARISRGDFRALALLGISSLLIQLPFLDRALSPIDEGSMLAIAESLSGGEVLYRDRATFISPACQTRTNPIRMNRMSAKRPTST